MISIQWDGTDTKVHAKISGITTYGSIPMHKGKPAIDACIIPEELGSDDARENNPPSPASEIWISPKVKEPSQKSTTIFTALPYHPPERPSAYQLQMQAVQHSHHDNSQRLVVNFQFGQPTDKDSL